MEPNSTNIEYRPDIDGLRAVAVLAVLGFHTFPELVPGGFVGVDIFFVISGFLISSILFQSFSQNTFTFIDFYSRRVRRIFPALAIVLLFCLIVGWHILLTDEYMQLGKNIFAGAGFIANVFYWKESGYFDASADSKPLLQLWSLGIEEQFYIFIPLLILLFWKKGKSPLLYFIILLAISSFAFNIYYRKIDVPTIFFLPQARFWELLFGSLLAWLNYSNLLQQSLRTWQLRLKNVNKLLLSLLSVFGLSMILASFFVIEKGLLFPGWWALMPVFGAFILISLGKNALVNRTILANGLLKRISLISYPLYLWHWPLLSFATILYGQPPPVDIKWGLITLSFILAFLTYRFIEIPFRFGKELPLKTLALLILMAALLVSGCIIYFYKGFPNRPAASLVEINPIGVHEDATKFVENHYFKCETLTLKKSIEVGEIRDCFQSKTLMPIDAIIIGDSHSAHLFPGLAKQYEELNLAYLTIPEANFTAATKAVSTDSNIKAVIFSVYWHRRFVTEELTNQLYIKEFNSAIRLLSLTPKKIYISDGIPDFMFGPKKCQYQRLSGVPPICNKDAILAKLDYESYAGYLKASLREGTDVSILPIYKYFCNSSDCSMLQDKKILYVDTNHLNLAGSDFVARNVKQEYPKLF